MKEVIPNTLSKFFRLKPTSLTLLVTNQCNARCVMCNIWQYGVSGETDLSLEQYDDILGNPLLKNVVTVNLSGGEALLRKDILDLVCLIFHKLPGIKRLFIATNGLASGPTVNKIEQILKLMCDLFPEKPPQLYVQVSYDGVSDVHDKIRGPNAHIRVTKTLDQLIELRKKYKNLGLGAGCVVQPLNLTELDLVKAYLKEKEIDYIFPIVCTNGNYYKNESEDGVIHFSPEEIRQVKQFYSRMVKYEGRLGRKVLYWDFLRILNGLESKRGCPIMREALIIEPDGRIMPCLNSEELSYGNAVNEDIEQVWSSNHTKTIMEEIKAEKCKTCMFACGVTYMDGIGNYILDTWHRTNILNSQ